MKNRVITTILLSLVAVATAVAQNIRLTILEKDSKEPVPMAYVNIYSMPNRALQTTTVSDANGIADIKPSSYPCKLEVVIIGYEPFSFDYATQPVDGNLAVQLTRKFNSLNDVVLTGIAQPTKLKDALSVYQVIPQAVIQAQGAVTLNDVLKNQLNMSVGNDNVLGTNVNMQVSGGDKVKILVDGLPVNGREAGNINLSQLNLNNAERIEIIQGPMSVVYGSDAVGGTINIITKKERKPFDISIKGYYESVGKYNSTANLTFKMFKRHQITLGGGRNLFTGYQHIDVPKTFNGETINTERAYFFKPNSQDIANFAYGYSAPSGFKINLNSDYIKDRTINKGSLDTWDPYKGAYAFDEYYTADRLLNRLSLGGKLGNRGLWNMQNGYAYYYRTKNRYYTNLTSPDFQQTLTKGPGEQDTTKFDDITSRGSYSNNINKLKYTVGYDINLEYAFSLKILNRSNNIQDYAIYTNLNYPVVKDKLSAQLGLRAAINSKYTPPVIPSLNILYTPLKNLQVRGSYAQGYRAPTLKEQLLSFIDGGTHDITGNPNLTAEQSNHAQVSVSYQAYEKQADYLQFIFTGYFNEVKNGIGLVNKEPGTIKYTYLNIAHQSNTIASLQTDGQWRNIHAQLGYSYRLNFAEKGQYDSYGASEATIMLQYGWQMTGLNFNLFYKYTGKQTFISYDNEGIAQANGTQMPYNLLDASLEKKFINKKVQIVAGLKNIFNIRSTQVNGAILVSSHGSGGGMTGNFLPRSFFTSVNVNIE